MWVDQTERPVRADDLHAEEVKASLAAYRQHRADRRDGDEPASLPPADPTARIRRYSEPLIKERGANPNGLVWHLMSVIAEMREGLIAPARKMFPWNREQIEALWDNVANAWSLGPIVALDQTGLALAPWPERFGPYPTSHNLGKRILILSGAEKLAAIAWSLEEPPLPALERAAPEETAIWSRYTLVAEPDLRRIRFVWGKVDPVRQVPVRLLPDAALCLKAQNAMDLTPIAREWLNRTARRLMETYLSVHIFPYAARDEAEQMLSNLRQISAV
jgi:hypothetical protein